MPPSLHGERAGSTWFSPCWTCALTYSSGPWVRVLLGPLFWNVYYNSALSPPIAVSDSFCFSHVTQCFDQQSEGRGGLPPARIIKMVARIRLAPVLQHALETTLGDMGLCQVLRHIGQAEPGKRRIENLQRSL